MKQMLDKNPIEPKDVIKNWLRAKTNIEFLALWEQMHNPNLKGVEIDTFKMVEHMHIQILHLSLRVGLVQNLICT